MSTNTIPAVEGFSVMDAAEKVARAKSALMRSHPMWGTLLMKLKLRETKHAGVKTMITDGRVVEWSRAFVDALSIEETMTVLAHEVGHCALKHVFRQGQRDHKAYEEAADHVINLLLTEGGFTFPQGDKHYCDAQFQGMSVEQVYPIVLARREAEEQQRQQEQQKQQQKQKQDGEQSDADESESGQQQEGGEQEGEVEAEESNSMGEMAAPGSLGDGDEGEPSDQQPEEEESEEEADEESEQQSPDDRAEEENEDESQRKQQQKDGDSGDAEQEGNETEGKQEQSNEQQQSQEQGDEEGAMSEADQRALENDWSQAAAAAAQQAVQRGHGSSQQQRVILASNSRVLSFEEYVRYFLARCTDRSEQTWRRQSRRSIDTGVYLPGRRGQRIGALVAVVDTSGSIDNEILARFVVQIAAAQSDLRPSQIILLAADDAVCNEVRFERSEPFSPERDMLKGGGGTDFRPAFERVLQIRDEEGIDIAGVLYLTDLQGDFPTADDAAARDFPPTLWCLDASSCYNVEQKKQLVASVPFGEVAEIQK